MTSFITPEIWKAYQHPHYTKPLRNFTHEATLVNELCGDSVSVQLLFEDDIFVDAFVETTGCSLVVAGISLYLDACLDRNIYIIKKDQLKDWLSIFDPPIPNGRHKCISLGFEAVKKALQT